MLTSVHMKKFSRQYKWQEEQKKKGLCITCGKKALNKTYCKDCRDARNKRRREWYKMPTLDIKI